MDKMHDYIVKGHPKVKIIFGLAIISSIIAPQVTKLLTYLINQQLHFKSVFIVTTATVFTVIFWIYSKWLWKNKLFCKLLKYPNLNGCYKVDSLSLKNPSGTEKTWDGNLTITQNWNKILIILKTSTSSSESVRATIEYIPGKGYQLNYDYNNIPKNSETELDIHNGTAEITFTENILNGEGKYDNKINEHLSCGTMQLRRSLGA